MESPKSLTALVHIRFHYGEVPSKPPGKSEIEILAGLLDHASELDPTLQELLVKFADYIKKTSEEAGVGQNPG